MKMNVVKGYKVFNPDWTCRGKQYSCPGKFEEDVEIFICKRGMHFCKKLINCFGYYDFDPQNHVAEVVAYGEVVSRKNKCATDKLEIIREIPWNEVLERVNTGDCNTGYRNTGDYNSGNYNSGDWNSGYRNAANHNTGSYNSGDYNSGYCNTGDYNSGDCNTGDWNATNHSSGCFNTVEQKICLFNKPSDWTYQVWIRSDAHAVMTSIPSRLEWVEFIDMTADEQAKHPNAKTMGGYLKNYSVPEQTERVNRWWRGLPEKSRDVVKSIPNFDKEIFKQITGIDVDVH